MTTTDEFARAFGILTCEVSGLAANDERRIGREGVLTTVLVNTNENYLTFKDAQYGYVKLRSGDTFRFNGEGIVVGPVLSGTVYYQLS